MPHGGVTHGTTAYVCDHRISILFYKNRDFRTLPVELKCGNCSIVVAIAIRADVISLFYSVTHC